MRISVINYTGDRGNWGSQATSGELLKQLARVAPTATFHLVPLRKSKGIDAIINLRWRRKIEAALSEPSPTGDHLLAKAARAIYREDFDIAVEAECAIFQPEGTMDGLRFTTGARLLLLPAALAAVNKRVVCLNGSAETKDPQFEPAIAGCFNRFHVVAMREPASVRFIAGLGVKRVRSIPDTAFLARPSVHSPIDLQGQAYLAVTGSAILREVDWQSYIQQVRTFAQEKCLKVVCLLSAPADQKTIGYRIKTGQHADTVQVPSSASYEEVARVIANASLLVGGRYHMSVLAATVGTPFVPLPSGSHKTAGLLELLDYPLSCVDFGDASGLLAVCNHALENRAELSHKLTTESEAIRRVIATELESLAGEFKDSGS